jgi:amino acid transporter
MVLLLIVLFLALAGNISELASATSLLLLLVFALMNAALIILKFRPGETRGDFEIPVFVPVLGFLICAALVVSRLLHPAAGGNAPLIAGVMLAGISGLYFLTRPKAVS